MSVSFHLGRLKHGATTIDFVRDLNLDMSNGRARMVLNALGLDTGDLCGHMDRVQFANLCTSWLQQHIGKQSAKIEASVTRGTFGATFIDCGVFQRATSISGFDSYRKQHGQQKMVTSSTGVDPARVRLGAPEPARIAPGGR